MLLVLKWPLIMRNENVVLYYLVLGQGGGGEGEREGGGEGED